MPPAPIAPALGRWVWTCRAGFEPHLFEELAWANARPRLLGEALVETGASLKVPPAFGRMGFRVEGTGDPLALPESVLPRLRELVGERPFAVQAWTVDTERANTLGSLVEVLGERVGQVFGRAPLEPWRARELGGVLVQAMVASPTLAVLGLVEARDAASLAAGGRMRMRRGEQAPSRAAAKLEEALEWVGRAPSSDDVCVDLGAAPGGWTERLIHRGAKVIAVDPAKLSPSLQAHRRVRHVQDSAFAFAPNEPVDWLFCDMAWRPLEVAQLLAKWARRAWAQQLVANIKLPMKDKNPTLFRVRNTLETGGWRHLKVRQLYHDRDEVTVSARRME